MENYESYEDVSLVPEKVFSEQVAEEVKDWEKLMTVKCPFCKGKYNLQKVRFSGSNPVCPHCGS